MERLHSSLTDLKVLIRGAGEQATGIAHRLMRSHLKVSMTEIAHPMAVRRHVSFCEAVWDKTATVEGLTAKLVTGAEGFNDAFSMGFLPVLVDPELKSLEEWRPDVFIDATLAKRNLGTDRDMAPLVIGFGPGFTAGVDVDVVVESNRGHDMGRLIFEGTAEPNTGVPGDTAGYTVQRVLRAPCDGNIEVIKDIGALVELGEPVLRVGDKTVTAGLTGIIRGMLRPGMPVTKGLKAGDIDPRTDRDRSRTISEKARALGGSALEAIMMRFNV